mgnify:CR=1 FL=1
MQVRELLEGGFQEVPRGLRVAERLDEDEADNAGREELDKVRQKVRVERIEDRKIRLTFRGDADPGKLTREFLEKYFPLASSYELPSRGPGGADPQRPQPRARSRSSSLSRFL